MKRRSGFEFGNKMGMKTWDDYDQEKEENKLAWVLAGTVIVMLILALVMELIKLALTKG